MKKKLVALTLCLSMAMSLFGCGKEDSDTDKDTTGGTNIASTVEMVDDTEKDLNILDYVKLADFKGLELTKEVETVSDEDVADTIEDSPVEITVDGATVADGDTVIIDYVGKKDGVAFEGGSATNSELEIGSNTFIDGFEEGLIGVKKGETVDLKLTFPSEYHSEELAGQAVVFTVTVNRILRSPETLTDEFLVENTNYKTIAEYTAYVKSELEAEADKTASYTIESEALDKVVANSEVTKYYKSLVEEGEAQYAAYIEAYASMYGVELNEFLEQMGMTEDDYKKEKATQGENYAKVAMIVKAIASEAGLTEEDDEYQRILNETAGDYNMDVDTFKSTYGESLVQMSVLSEYVMDYLVDNAKVTTKMIEDEEDTSATSETQE